jgi:predicted transcriptional regulator
MEPRKYRTRLEILHDFLEAIRKTGKKTHIIGLSNLNPSSFQPYLDFSIALELVKVTPAGYQLTPRAEAVIEVIQRLLARSSEVDAALLDLHRGFNGSNLSEPSTKGALRYVSILAWNEVVRSAAGFLEDKTEFSGGRLSVGLNRIATPATFKGAGTIDPEGDLAVRHLLPDTGPQVADPPPRRPARTRLQE